jgi:ribosomal protein uL23
MQADPYKILEYPLSTEKAVRKMEAENCLIFIVSRSATKRAIKWAVEKAFSAKVEAVNTMINRKGKKKAYIKLSPETPASEITSALGLV